MLNIFSLEQLNQSLAIKLEQTAFSLKGKTVQRWANGMFSNNIRKLQPNQGNYSAICDDRGRVQGFIYLYCLEKESFREAITREVSCQKLVCSQNLLMGLSFAPKDSGSKDMIFYIEMLTGSKH